MQEKIEVDWTVDSSQLVEEITWILQDSSGRILATDSILETDSSGLLKITIPDSLETSLYSILSIIVRGEYGSTDSEMFTINNIDQNTNLIVNINPDLARQVTH